MSKGASSNSKKMVSGGDSDRGNNLDVAVVGGHSDSGFKGEGGFFSLVVASASVLDGDYSFRSQFVQQWTLREDTKLSVFSIAEEYVRHAFPPGILADMASYSLADFIVPLCFSVA